MLKKISHFSERMRSNLLTDRKARRDVDTILKRFFALYHVSLLYRNFISALDISLYFFPQEKSIASVT